MERDDFFTALRTWNAVDLVETDVEHEFKQAYSAIYEDFVLNNLNSQYQKKTAVDDLLSTSIHRILQHPLIFNRHGCNRINISLKNINLGRGFFLYKENLAAVVEFSCSRVENYTLYLETPVTADRGSTWRNFSNSFRYVAYVTKDDYDSDYSGPANNPLE